MANLKEAVEAGLSALQNLCEDDGGVPPGANPGQWKLTMNEAKEAIEIMQRTLYLYDINDVSNPEIVLAYLEGKEIQYQDNDAGNWKSYHCYSDSQPMIGHLKYNWRVKPKTFKYRVGFYKSRGKEWTFCADSLHECEICEEHPHFVKWLTDWVEAEV